MLVALYMTATLSVSKPMQPSIYLLVMNHISKKLAKSFQQLSRATCVVVRLTNITRNTNMNIPNK